jgi:hypothetical protein
MSYTYSVALWYSRLVTGCALFDSAHVVGHTLIVSACVMHGRIVSGHVAGMCSARSDRLGICCRHVFCSVGSSRDILDVLVKGISDIGRLSDSASDVPRVFPGCFPSSGLA